MLAHDHITDHGPDRHGALHLAVTRHQNALERTARSFLSLEDISAPEMNALIHLALEMKKEPDAFSSVLRGQAVALLFQKTSTRTRCSFEVGVHELGGQSSYIDWRTSNFVLADLKDEIKALGKYYDMIMSRVILHETLTTMAAYSGVPVINGMCNRMHPCQVLSDFMTLAEYFGPNLNGLRIAYIGDGNNVCRSLAHGAVHMGAQLTLCSPRGYELDEATVEAGKGLIVRQQDPVDAIWDADVIYADTWISIGDESQTEERLAAFQGYQIDEALLEQAPPTALVMHCLPAHPGQEISPGVLRCPRSIVFDQAENRKHAQKALMARFAAKL